MTDADMFLRPAVCRSCGAFVLDEIGHRNFHKAIEDAFKARDAEVRRVLEKAGGMRKKERSPRPDRYAHNKPGGLCRSCRSVLVLVEYEFPSRRNDSTVPYLICTGCHREIRRG